jgi:hypothetical protein
LHHKRNLRIFFLTSVALAFFVASSHGEDRGQYPKTDPEIKKWINGLTDKRKQNCCSVADGFSLETASWRIGVNSYFVTINGVEYRVPDDAIVNAPNRPRELGAAMVWPATDIRGRITGIRCFLVGAAG